MAEKCYDLGTTMTLSTTRRDREIEERFKIFPGSVYRITIVGTNPETGVSYVGKLEEVTMHVCLKGFDPRFVELRDGFSYSTDGVRQPFEREMISLLNERVINFGRVKDEEGFRKRRESIIH